MQFVQVEMQDKTVKETESDEETAVQKLWRCLGVFPKICERSLQPVDKLALAGRVGRREPITNDVGLHMF